MVSQVRINVKALVRKTGVGYQYFLIRGAPILLTKLNWYLKSLMHTLSVSPACLSSGPWAWILVLSSKKEKILEIVLILSLRVLRVAAHSQSQAFIWPFMGKDGWKHAAWNIHTWKWEGKCAKPWKRLKQQTKKPTWALSNILVMGLVPPNAAISSLHCSCQDITTMGKIIDLNTTTASNWLHL